MSEFIDSFLEHFKNRFSNVLIAAFILSWMVCNWSIVLLVFSDLKFEEKFHFIKGYWNVPGLCNLIVYPIISTALFPWVSAGLRIYNTWSQGMSRKALYKAASVDVVPSAKVGELLEEKDAKIRESFQKINELYDLLRMERDRLNHHETVIASMKETELTTTARARDLDETNRALIEKIQVLEADSRDRDIKVAEAGNLLRKEQEKTALLTAKLERHAPYMTQLLNDKYLVDIIVQRNGVGFVDQLRSFYGPP